MLLVYASRKYLLFFELLFSPGVKGIRKRVRIGAKREKFKVNSRVSSRPKKENRIYHGQANLSIVSRDYFRLRDSTKSPVERGRGMLDGH